MLRRHPAFLSVLASSAFIAQSSGQPSTIAKPSTPVTVTNGPTAPVPVVVPQTVQTTVQIPPRQFSLPPQAVTTTPTGSSAMPPLGPSTQFAISSVVVTNASANAQTVSLAVIAAPYGRTDTDCSVAVAASSQRPGPKVSVPAHSTVMLNFAQPFVTQGIQEDSNRVCLAAWGDTSSADVTWSAVGYIPPVGSVGAL
jgi:hypothetical protein